MSQFADLINQFNQLTGYNVPTASGYILSQSANPVGSGSVNTIISYINSLTGFDIPTTDVQYVSGSNVAGPIIIYAPYAAGGTIPVEGIAPGGIIRAQHVLDIINALNGTDVTDIIISGSFSTSGSNTINGSLALPFITDGRFLYVSGGYVAGIDIPPSASSAISASYALTASYADTASYAIGYLLVSSTASMLEPYVLTSQTSSMSVLSSSYALTSSFANSASYAVTASYALNAGTSTLQQVVNNGNGIANFAGIGSASIQSTNFTNGRTLYLNDNAFPTIKLVDNANASNYLQIDIDTLNIDGVSYNWSSIVNPTTGPLLALPFTTDHLAVTNNEYVVGDVVYYIGNVYRCIANNDSLQPNLAPQYWTLLGPGFPLVQQPSDWNSTSGNNQILNKPTIPTFDTSSLVTTASFNSFTASYNTGSFTGSFIGDGSGLTNIPTQSIDTGSFATTGSNTFYGLQTISASGADLSALDIHMKDDSLWALRIYNDTYSSSSIGLASWIDNSGISFLGTETDKPLYIYNNADYYSPTLIVSRSGVTIDNTLTVNDGITGSLEGTASWATNAVTTSYAATASFAPAYLPLSGGTIDGDVTVNGTASISFLNVTIESASVIYSSGSNQFGDATDDTQSLFGRVIISGSLEVTGSANLPDLTGSLYGTASHAISASWAPANAAGNDSEIQYNDNGLLAGASAFKINKTSQGIELGSTLVQATGVGSFAMGNIVSAAGVSAFAQGDTLGGANGEYSFARGRATTAEGNYSYAGGDDSIAVGPFSYAQGLGLIASGTYQVVIGQSNLPNNDTSLFVIGNGTGAGNRSDVMRVNLTGVEITGSLTVSGSNTFTNIGPAVFSGSVVSTNGITASLEGTASWATNAETASNILGGKATHVPFFITDTTLATSSIYQSGSTSVIINQDNNTTDAPEALYVWQPSLTSFNVISGKGDLNNYLQLNIQNKDQGVNASSDIVATSNNGDENGGYIDMGINSDIFSGPIGGPLDAYLYATGSHLHIGNITPNMPIQFFVGGIDTNTNRKFELNTNNSHNMTGSLDISGSLNVRNNLTSSGLLTNGNNNILGNTTMSGSSTIQGTTTMTGSLNITGSTTQIGNNTLIGNTLLSGSIIISGSQGPGSPTASVQVYGDIRQSGYHRFDPVTTNIDTSVSASYIYVSGSTNDLYFSQNGSGYNNVTRLRWLEGNLYTGLLHGGIISQLTSTTYQVGSGSGIIVDLNTSFGDDPYPTVQFLKWNNLSASIAPLTASYDQQFVAINSSNQIFAQGIPYTNGDYNDKIPIGIVLHQNRSTINGVQTFPGVAYGWKQRSFDFIKAFGALKISGYTLSQSGSSARGLLLSGGTSWVDGRNYTVDPNMPSYIVEAVGTTTSKIFRYYQSGSNWESNWGYNTNGGAGFTDIDPTQYSNAGTLTPVSSNNFTIQRVFYFPNSATKALFVYYGNAQYANEEDALAAVNTEIFSESPNTAASAIYIGFMLLRHNADFNTAASYELYKAGLFRGAGAGGGSGGGGGGATSLAGLTDVAISGETNGQPLVYDTATTKWINSSALTASLHGTASWAEYVVNSGANAFPYTGSALITGSLVITGSTISTLGFTGSLFGTSSWAINASQAVSSSYATSASYATTAQNLLGSVTSADTASHAVNFTIDQTLTLNETLTRRVNVNSTSVGSNSFDQATGSFTSAHGKYTVYKDTNARAGEFVTAWNGTTTTYYDNATVDIGNTSDITFTSVIASGDVKINAVAASSGWTVKMLVTYL